MEEQEGQYFNNERRLKDLLNSTYSKNLSKDFKECLEEFNKMGIKLSVTYLSNLIDSTDKKFISQRVSYILRISNLRKEQTTKSFKEWVFKKSKTEAVVYYEKDNKILDTHRTLKIGKSYIRNSIKLINNITDTPERIINPIWIESDGEVLSPITYQDGYYLNSIGQKIRG